MILRSWDRQPAIAPTNSLFPEHPLSRVRGLLRQIGGSVQIADELKGY